MAYLFNIYKDDNQVYKKYSDYIVREDKLENEVFLKEENELVSIYGRSQVAMIANALDMSQLESDNYGIIDQSSLMKIQEKIHSGSYKEEFEECNWLSEKQRTDLLDSLECIVGLIKESVHQNVYVIVWHDIND
ncbi:hypothetical protein [Stenotrophomonas maltophilia group sp. RNC7]|uniref:hypothetical protein n=1 Tax=Stenotrophomonas maltophilia group sp. RNC7 TaxID=3071467 RepID=UPI0027DFBFCF|nr:hypothetical protein [Stenotrophomonas maltophilia group sp. RNC7]MDQ4679856.1 hypothetical protein [Stenotrophomonas maltophilia group sp. RNC7]